MNLATRRSRTAFVAACAALSLSLAACGSDSLEEGGETKSSAPAVKATKDSALADLVPADLKDKGTLSIGTDATYPPNESFASDGKTIQGMDIDLLRAVLGKLGLKGTFQNAGFDSLILGVKSGKYDASISSFTINEERKKQVSMVSYYTAGTQWVVAKGNAKKVDIDDPCGLTVAVQKGTVQVSDLDKRSKKCVSDGKKPIKSLIDDGQDKATLNAVSGRADAMVADLPVAVDAVNKNDGKIELLGKPYDTAPYGIVIPKGDKKFGDVLVKGLEAIKKDGTYDKVLKKWGTEGGAYDTFEMDPATS
ncbi:ABC transporter substrate-binding protein [Demetria terragena]|uniref:ABC transporter substrate-binding protein n=1 Tax=Demetria terragena TaxID=63959 RepID=UPI000361FE63|nr:ABC transporter substrate-binding protein [Demetria terragena]